MYWLGLLVEVQIVSAVMLDESEKLRSRFLRHVNLIPELRERNFEVTLYSEGIRRPASFTKALQNDTASLSGQLMKTAVRYEFYTRHQPSIHKN